MNAPAPRFLVVEGPIGVGKTSLARRIAQAYGTELLLERAEENPFLERFYRDPRHFALPTQLYFLFQRARQLAALRQSDLFAPVRVADFLLEKDRLFAQLNLADDELALYEQAYHALSLDAPAPDLVVYLQAPVEALMKRVQKRALPAEQPITFEYLSKVADSYMRFFHHYDRAPLLIVNASDINPVESDADFKTLMQQIEKVRGGRHYFNPAAR
jgi:deoxyadenosine/deoxycytidine kinase